MKDKRPTISPNFNFLGQLLEYEKQMKKEKGEQENVSPPLSSTPSKKHRSEGSASPAVLPVKSPKSRYSFKPFVFSGHSQSSEAVQSPSTALSKLSFTAPSPVIEDPETPRSSDAFPQFPTTSLDLLNFTPCLASNSREASPAKSTTSEAKSPSAGSKRPLSSTSLSLELESTQENIESSCPGGGHCTPQEHSQQQTVKYRRSPETRAKRPLVRPNSIAFSSYPSFDIGATAATTTTTNTIQSSGEAPLAVISSCESSQESSCSTVQMDYTITTCSLSSAPGVSCTQTDFAVSTSDLSAPGVSTTASSTSGNTQSTAATYASVVKNERHHHHRGKISKKRQQQTHHDNTGSMVTSNSSYVVEMRSKEQSQNRGSSFEQQRKSRSLEDILNMDGDETSGSAGGCPSHVRSRRQKKLLNAAELLSHTGAAVEAMQRCRGPGESHHHHQSSSSISSSGSHGSLHGSVEIIQVS